MSVPEVSSFFELENSYADLGLVFSVPTLPNPVKSPRWIAFNHELAQQLGAQQLTENEQCALLPVFAGNARLAGARPIAQVYAGHQFGHFNPQLGDGRAILLSEVLAPKGEKKDIQLKGAGLTPFSRSGDGRAAIGPVMREYLLSEAMHALGIPTTRALAAVTTGQQVYRETALPGAVLTRVASSHIRIGTFEFFARKGDMANVKILSDYVITRHYPLCAQAKAPYKALFESIMSAQIALVARWMSIGFIHGVMNTDNMSIAGETIDYGPCAFMDVYHRETSYSAIDTQGRYAFGNQKPILQWNLARLAECLLRLFDDDIEQAVAYAEQTLAGFNEQFDTVYFGLMARKLGLQELAIAKPVITDFLVLLEQQKADYTLAFRQLGNALLKQDKAVFLNVFAQGDAQAAAAKWYARWINVLNTQCLKANSSALHLTDEQEPKLIYDQCHKLTAVATQMQKINPAIIPRNHHVEAMIAQAIALQQTASASSPLEYSQFEALLKALKTPFDAAHEASAFAKPPAIDQQRAYRTFCGT